MSSWHTNWPRQIHDSPTNQDESMIHQLTKKSPWLTNWPRWVHDSPTDQDESMTHQLTKMNPWFTNWPRWVYDSPTDQDESMTHWLTKMSPWVMTHQLTKMICKYPCKIQIYLFYRYIMPQTFIKLQLVKHSKSFLLISKTS